LRPALITSSAAPVGQAALPLQIAGPRDAPARR
jgi:hypothetical protein